jgi:transcriptional regulator with XRE-family HTH domain
LWQDVCVIDPVALPAQPTLDAVLEAVGPRLRSLRQTRSLTLAALAAETGISVSTLSRLESGERRPTLELLLPLARVFGLPLDDLVGAPQTGDPRIHLKPRQHHGRVIVPLTRRPGGVRAFKQLIPPSTARQEQQLASHEGYEWLYVLSGRVALLLGEQSFDLGPGEVAEFDTRTPHWVGNHGEQTAEALCLYGPQGERAHLRT